MFEQLEKELTQNDLETMKASAIDFLKKDIESLRHFIEKTNTDFGQSDLAFALKMFILNSNKVFNMAEYMKNQSRFAEENLESQNRDFNSEERRDFLNRWVEDNAGHYRKQVIFKQICCIDKISGELVPVIEKMIEK
jgi:hypothetical protein